MEAEIQPKHNPSRAAQPLAGMVDTVNQPKA